MYCNPTHLILGHIIPGVFCVFKMNDHWAVSHAIKIEMAALEATELLLTLQTTENGRIRCIITLLQAHLMKGYACFMSLHGLYTYSIIVTVSKPNFSKWLLYIYLSIIHNHHLSCLGS